MFLLMNFFSSVGQPQYGSLGAVTETIPPELMAGQQQVRKKSNTTRFPVKCFIHPSTILAMTLIKPGIGERGGIVIERQTPNREFLGSIPTGVSVLCP